MFNAVHPVAAKQWPDELAEAENVVTANFPEQNGPNACMIETSWVTMTKAERLFFAEANWHVQREAVPFAEETATDSYDWVWLPMSLANGLYENGWLDLSRFPCQQLNGSFNALSALRKTVQCAKQDAFDLDQTAEPIACASSAERGLRQ